MDSNFYDLLFQISRQKELNFKKFQETFNLDCGYVEELIQFVLDNLSITDRKEFVKKYDHDFQTFDFYFMIGVVKNHPGGILMIRSNELLLLNSLPQNVKDQLVKRMEIEKKTNEGIKAYNVLNEDGSEDYGVLHISRRSRRKEYAIDQAHNELVKSLGILNFLNHRFSLSFYKFYHDCYVVLKNNSLDSPFMFTDTEEVFYLDDDIIKNLNYISNIFQKSKKSDIERRIIKSLEIFSQIQKSTEAIVKILIYVTMLENLLLDEDDKDYLGWKLADRVAFLIGDKKSIIDEIIFPEFSIKYPAMSKNSKYVIADFVRDLYNIRSRYVHSNKSNKEIGLFDKSLLIGHNIVHETLSEFFKLEEEGIFSLTGKDGLIERLDIQKYQRLCSTNN